MRFFPSPAVHRVQRPRNVSSHSSSLDGGSDTFSRAFGEGVDRDEDLG